jgi:S-adenosylmethionine:tRNA ribosyltransferase-isomerase
MGARAVRADELDYELPPELVAQSAAEPRDAARLLVYERASGAVRHRRFRDLLSELGDDDLVVVNDTRVLPARVHVRRESGAAAELLVLERRGGDRWEALARPYRRLRPGEELRGAEDTAFRVVERLGEGRVVIEPANGVPLAGALECAGEAPLPPYIRRRPDDPERYQTVYAAKPGSAAAPTAGLHFTEELWRALHASHEVVAVTLSVGLDTFRPVVEADLAEHQIHSEAYVVPPATADAVRGALAGGRRVVAVGTTVVRVLETAFGERGGPLAGRTDLFITPGYRFRATGALVTNFHLPRSTLLALVMAFAGREEVRALYATAIRERYRFYSFGDATFIL